MEELEFVSEPPKPTTRWTPVRQALRERPGEWARVATNASRTISVIFPRADGFETTVRKTVSDAPRDARVYDIYARYVGSKEAQ
jgi:hypothetical protein